MDTNCYGGWAGITSFAPLALVLFDSGAWPPCLTPLDSALTGTAPPTRVESTLPEHHGSVSKQTALSHLESALTGQLASSTKQTASNRAESTLTRFLYLTNLESTLTKKGGGGYPQAERRRHRGTAIIRACISAGAKGARVSKLSAITQHPQIHTSRSNHQSQVTIHSPFPATQTPPPHPMDIAWRTNAYNL
jgi:hypothetical protein